MNQNWLDKLERKFGKYALTGLMKYIVAIELIGAMIGIINPQVYFTFFAFDIRAILRGQIWRLITFVFYPELTSLDIVSILFFAIEVYLYYFIGNTLERVWGSFRFNVYYISGLLLSIVAGIIVFLATGISMWPVGFSYINQALFLAFATLFPDMEFMLMFLIPVKAKWLGFVYAGLMVMNVLQFIASGNIIGYAYAAAIIVSMLNFLIFFLSSRNMKRFSYRERKRKADFKRSAGPKVTPLFRHRCAICGRTERDNPDLEFRFCSKCEGNFEYCSDHIYTHEHVKRGV